MSASSEAAPGRTSLRKKPLPKSIFACRPLRMPSDFVAKILNLKSRTEGVDVKVSGALKRPPYEKGNAGAALYEHAKRSPRKSASIWWTPSTGGGSDGNFTAPHRRDARWSRREWRRHRIPVTGDSFVNRAAGTTGASAVSDAAMTSPPTIRRSRPIVRRCHRRSPARLVLRTAQGPQAALALRPI